MLGRESLMIYVAHLIVLYGSPLNHGAGYYFGATLTLWQSTCAFGILFLAMLLLADIWHGLKKRHPIHIRFALFATTVSLILLFVTRKY